MCVEGSLLVELQDQRRDGRDRCLKRAHTGRNTNPGSKVARKTVSIDGPWYRHKTRPPLTNEEKVKSEMCRNLEEKGFCFYGVGCKFAHDKSELKIVMRHPKHKTQLCNDYHGKPALCMFGSRCSYIHESGPRLSELKRDESYNDGISPIASPLLSHRLQTLEKTIHEYSLDKVRAILKCRGVSQDDIRVIEKLPSVVLSLLRRALTSPHANQKYETATSVPEKPRPKIAETERNSVENAWFSPVRVIQNLDKLSEHVTPTDDYLTALPVSGRGA